MTTSVTAPWRHLSISICPPHTPSTMPDTQSELVKCQPLLRAGHVVVTSLPPAREAAPEAQVGAGQNTREIREQGGDGPYVSQGAPKGAGRAPAEHSLSAARAGSFSPPSTRGVQAAGIREALSQGLRKTTFSIQKWGGCVSLERALPPALLLRRRESLYIHTAQKILQGSSTRLTGAAIKRDHLFNSFLVKRSSLGMGRRKIDLVTITDPEQQLFFLPYV